MQVRPLRYSLPRVLTTFYCLVTGVQAAREAVRAALAEAGVVVGTEFYPGQRVELHGAIGDPRPIKYTSLLQHPC
jgi:hypothetical protein